MSENTEIVRNAYEKFQTGDIEALLQTFTDDISWNPPEINGVGFMGSRSGIDSVREFFVELDKNEEFSQFEPIEYITEGDRVVVLGRSVGQVKPTGKKIDVEWVHLFTVQNGKIAKFQEFFDTASIEKAYQHTAAA